MYNLKYTSTEFDIIIKNAEDFYINLRLFGCFGEISKLETFRRNSIEKGEKMVYNRSVQLKRIYVRCKGEK